MSSARDQLLELPDERLLRVVVAGERLMGEPALRAAVDAVRAARQIVHDLGSPTTHTYDTESQ
jgi:hypothetical protein